MYHNYAFSFNKSEKYEYCNYCSKGKLIYFEIIWTYSNVQQNKKKSSLAE